MTLIVSVILIGAMLLLTAYTMINSNHYFVHPILEARSIERISDEANSFLAIPLEETSASETLPAFDVSLAQKNFSLLQILLMLCTVFSGILLTYYLLGKALLPLKKLNEATIQIDAHKLNTQITVPHSQDEIATLTNSFNSMLIRLNDSFELQKNFAQNAAHELKTPLSVIKSSLQVLNLDETPRLEDYKENAQFIAQSTDELIKIVEQLLSLTQKSNLKQEDILLNTIINDCVKEQEDALLQKNNTLTLQLEKILLTTNEPLLKSILSNILSNAIKYNKPNGTIVINTTTTNSDAQIIIRDTGIGINKKDLSCIFEPFFRADPSRSKEIIGNGLGLSIAKMAIEMLQGKIEVTSTLNEGTSFIITLPFLLPPQ